MKGYSCWSFPYRKRYYLTHPWKWFKHLKSNIRDVYLRARYGWCYNDVWDWDYWFMNTVPHMFRYLAEHGCAYPGRAPFETPEKWHDWLNEMADLIETGKEEWQDEHNEYYKEYIDKLMTKPLFSEEKDENGNVHHIMNTRTGLDDNYFKRAKELADQGDKNIRFVFSQLSEKFYFVGLKI